MNTIHRSLTFLLISLGTLVATTNAQSPPPIIIQAATPVPAASVATPVTQTSDSTTAAIKILQELKAANEETLKKQQAVLEQLDELQKAAEQLKIFGKRG
jgi:hypothetical protein